MNRGVFIKSRTIAIDLECAFLFEYCELFLPLVTSVCFALHVTLFILGDGVNLCFS